MPVAHNLQDALPEGDSLRRGINDLKSTPNDAARSSTTHFAARENRQYEWLMRSVW